MTWIFGSFQVTLCALTSCHVWLVNKGMAAYRGSQGQQVRNRKEATWYENHAVRFRQSRKLRVERGIRSRSEALGRLWRYGFQVGASFGTPWLPKEDMGQEVPTLWVYISQLTANCGSLSRIKWEIYFYKEVFRPFIDYYTTHERER